MKPAIALPFSAAYLRRKCAGEQRDVGRALAQRRHLEGDDVEPVVEVLAELPLRDHLLEVAVGRRDDADVDVDRLVAADALELALLQEAQQLHLDGRRDLADLVEEQRAAVGLLEAAVAPRRPRR